MINLPQLADTLQDAGLLNKSFQDCTHSEILQVISAVFSSVGDDVPADGWKEPRLEGGRLIVPHDVHPDFRWWTAEGKSIADILIQLDAPFEVAVKYWPRLTEAEWLNKLLPF